MPGLLNAQLEAFRGQLRGMRANQHLVVDDQVGVPEGQRKEIHAVSKMIQVGGGFDVRVDGDVVAEDRLRGQVWRGEPCFAVCFRGRVTVSVPRGVGDLEVHPGQPFMGCRRRVLAELAGMRHPPLLKMQPAGFRAPEMPLRAPSSEGRIGLCA